MPLTATMGLMLMTLSGLDLELAPWQAVNDGVMGGISSGGMTLADGILRFQGSLSLERNGGFASVRRPVTADLSGANGVRLEVRGDGRDYQFRIRLNRGFDGVAWRAEFATNGQWQTVELPLKDFVAVFRGSRVAGAGPLIPADIRQIGLLIADGTPGPFSLDIRAIGFVGSDLAADR